MSAFETDMLAAQLVGIFQPLHLRKVGSVVDIVRPIQSERMRSMMFEMKVNDLLSEARSAWAQYGIPGKPAALVKSLRSRLRATQQELDKCSLMVALLTPSACQLDISSIGTTDLAAAWLVEPEEHYYGQQRSVRYSLILLMASGNMYARRVIDTHDLQALPYALNDRVTENDDYGTRIKYWLQPDLGLGHYAERLKKADLLQDYRHIQGQETIRIRKHAASQLDPALVEQSNNLREYNLLNAAGDQKLRQTRLQTSAAFAGIPAIFADSKYGPALLSTVDSRRKLAPALAKAIGVEHWVVRRLATTSSDILLEMSLGPDSLTYERTIDLQRAAHFIQAMGPNYRFTSTSSVKAVWTFAKYIGLGYGNPDPYIHNWIYPAIGRYLSSRPNANLGALAESWRFDGIGQEELGDYFSFISSAISAASSQHDGFIHRALDNNLYRAKAALFESADLDDIKRWCLRYHEQIVPLMSLAARPTSNDNVPELLSECSLPKTGWSVRQLRDSTQLRTEGIEMNHCVHTYAPAVQAAAIAIFSLRPVIGDGITVELRCSSKGAWQVFQARGPANAQLESIEGAQAALEEFLDTLEHNLPGLPPAVMDHYVASAARSYWGERLDFSTLLDFFGLAAWSSLRHCLPGSSHGRIELKLWDAYSKGNAKQIRAWKKEQQKLADQMGTYTHFMMRSLIHPDR
ncbi:PcfJ domain-containing protein [Stenotrophomonas geniculata]|uniref:PcfJ domain-containing protein n=1 Tax=Stenotrophomonas geniculata TaxID=86188 RepID=UPI002E77C05C|nr:PcfJ domain-containing protein [Stenotrophomonas geniculata]